MLNFNLTALAQQTDAALIEANWQLFKIETEISSVRARFDRQPTKELARKLNALEPKFNEALNPVSALNSVHAAYGWNRAWLVSGGHLHKSRHCSTCFPTTQFHLMPQCSGLSEEQIVELAGERACTVCYPSAPVDVLKRKSDLRTVDEEEAIKARAAAEDKRSAKERAKVQVEIIGWANRPETKTFGTVRSAQNEISSLLKDALYSEGTEPLNDNHAKNLASSATQARDNAQRILSTIIGRRDYAELRKAERLDFDTVWADLNARAVKNHAAEVRRYQKTGR